MTLWWWPSSSYDDHHHVSWPPLTQVSAGGSINMTSLDSVNNIRGGMLIQGVFFLGLTWSTVIVFISVNWWRNFMNFNCYNLYNLYFVLLKINLVLFIKILRFFLRMNSFCKSLTDFSKFEMKKSLNNNSLVIICSMWTVHWSYNKKWSCISNEVWLQWTFAFKRLKLYTASLYIITLKAWAMMRRHAHLEKIERLKLLFMIFYILTLYFVSGLFQYVQLLFEVWTSCS